MSAKIKTFRLPDVATKFVGQPAIITRDRTTDYPNYIDLGSAASWNLKKMGFGAGDRIGILSANSPEYIVLLLAIFRIKAIAVLLSTRLPMEQISNTLGEVNCGALIHSYRDFEKPRSCGVDYYNFDEIVRSNADKNQITIDGEVDFDQDATIIFTSGSTSTPKAVLHTFGNHYFSALGSYENIPFGQGDKWLLSLPLYHVGGLAIVFRALINGGAIIIPDGRMSLSDSITRFQPTHISLVATQVYRLLKESEAIDRLQKMKAILLGGSAIPSSLIRDSIKYRLPICTSYGSTEMASQISTTLPGDHAEKLFTSGRVLSHREIKISAEKEILLKGDTLFRGYIHVNEIRSPLTPEGWFASGDLGELDTDGYLTITGRRDNMFISGGENIQPEEIERELNKIEGVRDAIVVPVKDEEYGERPAAFIAMEGEFPGDIFFQKYLHGKIARFKVPDHVFPMPENQPKSDIKVQRARLKTIAERFLAGNR